MKKTLLSLLTIITLAGTAAAQVKLHLQSGDVADSAFWSTSNANGMLDGVNSNASHTMSWARVNKTGSSLADIPTRLFSDLQSKPTTLSGYGIANLGAATGTSLNIQGASDRVQLSVQGAQTASAILYNSAGGIVPTDGSPQSICADPSFIYVACQTGNAIDIFNYYTDLADGYGKAATISLSGGPKAVCTSNGFLFGATYTAGTLNAYASGATTALATASTSGHTVAVTASSDGSYVYVCNADPHDNVQAFHFDGTSTLTAVGSVSVTFPNAVATDDHYIYVLSEPPSVFPHTDQHLYIYDVSGHGNPSLVGSVVTGIGPTSISLQGNFVYVANIDDHSFQVVDVTTKTAPTIAATVMGFAFPNGILAVGNTLYLTDNAKLFAYNITTPSSPTLLSSLTFDNCFGVVATSEDTSNIYTVDATNNVLSNISFGITSQRAHYQEIKDFNGVLLAYLDEDGRLVVANAITSGSIVVNTTLQLKPLSAAPPIPLEGMLYHNGSDHHTYVWNGSAWKQLDN